MEKLIQNFLDYLSVERGFSPRTIEAYRHDLNKFVEFFESIGKNGILSITKEDVRRFLSEQAQTNGAVTRARKLSAIKSLFNYLDHEGIISANPVSGIEAPKLPEKEPTYLTQAEYQNLIATVKREATPFYLSRDLAIVVLLLGTGVRLSELVGLTLDRVNLEHSGRSIKVRGKGNKERIIPLTDEVVATLEQYLKIRPDVSSNHLFISRLGDELHARSVYGLVKKYLKATGIKKMKMAVHSLRHTFGTSLMNSGVNIVVIQELLGHKKIETTRRYLHINSADLRNAVDKLVLNKQI
ncbi:MAG TPA: tyrosine-type recombinase/integrase [Candidatus Paceibacterota bacterium]|nr:tyrosine-type recombinase/integrase [Candidatus Paceibacterota bacterium]